MKGVASGDLAADPEITPEEAERAWRDARQDHANGLDEDAQGLADTLKRAETLPEVKRRRDPYKNNRRRHRQRSSRVKVRFEAGRTKHISGKR